MCSCLYIWVVINVPKSCVKIADWDLDINEMYNNMKFKLAPAFKTLYLHNNNQKFVTSWISIQHDVAPRVNIL